MLNDLPVFPKPSSGKTFTWKPVDPGVDWNELIVSWNVKHAERAIIKFEARVLRDSGPTPWYTMGLWSLSPDRGVRTSIKGQKDADAEVMTDTLHLAKPGGKLELRAFMTTLDEEPEPGSGKSFRTQAAKPPRLSLVTLSFSSTDYTPPPSEPFREAWGKTIDIFQRSQMSYPDGNKLCSPTSVSMLLRHWADTLHRPELDYDVPLVQQGVDDPGWPGTGNWPFNTAYAGSLDGLRAYVTRFSGTADLERWIAAGYPIGCSVDLNKLQGIVGPRSGHLVVLLGFTADGDPIFNDPGWSKEVRHTYKRADFERAWADSHQTVYLVYPESVALPPVRS